MLLILSYVAGIDGPAGAERPSNYIREASLTNSDWKETMDLHINSNPQEN